MFTSTILYILLLSHLTLIVFGLDKRLECQNYGPVCAQSRDTCIFFESDCKLARYIYDTWTAFYEVDEFLCRDIRVNDSAICGPTRRSCVIFECPRFRKPIYAQSGKNCVTFPNECEMYNFSCENDLEFTVRPDIAYESDIGIETKCDGLSNSGEEDI